MSIYYIRAVLDEEEIFLSFDSTSSITKSQTGSISSFPIEDGAVISDHYVNNNIVISMTGRISDLKSLTRAEDGNLNKNTDTFITEIERLKRSAIPFDIFIGGGDESTSSIKNCVFESLDLSQDRTTGTRTGPTGNTNAYKIAFSAKQIRFARQARLRRGGIRDPVLVAQHEVKVAAAGNKQEVKEEKAVLYKSGTRVIPEATYLKYQKTNPRLAQRFSLVEED